MSPLAKQNRAFLTAQKLFKSPKKRKEKKSAISPEYSALSNDPSAKRLFDVDVRVDKDKVVRIEMTDKDEPAEVSQYFKKKFQLNNAATNALYRLLSHNMAEELARRAEEQQA